MSIITFLIINSLIALTGVACAFWLEAPSFFLKKTSGSLSILSYLIFWPYFILNTIALTLFRLFSQENALDEIIQICTWDVSLGLWIISDLPQRV
ncbi:MAG TPA: hypothetical protein ENF37_01665 [Beggiatoa sp.]|nr:hypothetical protein [Beggiatoa sp.]